MATIDNNNTGKIVAIDKDTAIYVLEKVQEAVEETIEDRFAKENEFWIRPKTTEEMFRTLWDKVNAILNKIKGGE